MGRKLLQEAADHVVKPAMELGGNAPFLVFDDADVDAAIEGAMIAKMRNLGEACTSANRFYVHEKVHDEFAKKLTAKMAALKVGNGLDESVAVGPLVNAAAKKKVIELVDDAVGKGAKILTGGKSPQGPGHFYPPTVLDDVPDRAPPPAGRDYRPGGSDSDLHGGKMQSSARTIPNTAFRLPVYEGPEPGHARIRAARFRNGRTRIAASFPIPPLRSAA